MVGCRKQAHVSIMKFGPAPGAPHLEYRATVRALPDFHEEKTYSLLRLPAIEGRSIEIVCDPSFSPWLTGLPRERELTFTVWQTKRVSWHTDDGKKARDLFICSADEHFDLYIITKDGFPPKFETSTDELRIVTEGEWFEIADDPDTDEKKSSTRKA